MAKSFIQVLIYLLSAAVFYFTWIIYPNIYSKKDLYRKSVVGIFIGRTVTALLVSVICALAVTSFFEDHKETNSSKPNSKADTSQPAVSNKQTQENETPPTKNQDTAPNEVKEKDLDEKPKGRIEDPVSNQPTATQG
jgi:hypothetical protein